MTTELYKIPAGVCAGLVAVLLISLISVVPAEAEIEAVPLEDSDCIKCHVEPAQQIAEKGGAHRTALGCFDCHEGHPPAETAVIPECSQCHEPSAHEHYALDNCTRCHAPHAPGVESLSVVSEDVPGVCLACHQDVGNALEEVSSAHTHMNCTDCHLEHGGEEGQFMQCMECHEPHSEDMGYTDCVGCHAPHQPTDYRWDSRTPVNQCAACHTNEVEDLERSGGAHADAVACVDCHADHPPAEDGVIPECAQCHAPDDSEHYRVGQCAQCHDPHAPMDIQMDAVSPVKPVCLSCHAAPGKEMEQHPSMHAEMDCMECHAEHGEASSCLDCHEGHTDSMTYSECLKCHQPHSPSYIQYHKGGVEPELCGSCHAGEFTQLEKNSSQHAMLECIFCHRRTHKVTLACEDCHGQPHDAAMHSQFNNCAKCHRGAHDLRK